MTRILALALAALTVGPASAQTFAPEAIEGGWSSQKLSLPDVDGAITVRWSVEIGAGSLPKVCGAWATDNPDLAPIAAAALAGGTAVEGGRRLLNGLTHFNQVADPDAMVGASAPCASTSGLSATAVQVSLGAISDDLAAALGEALGGSGGAAVAATGTAPEADGDGDGDGSDDEEGDDVDADTETEDG